MTNPELVPQRFDSPDMRPLLVEADSAAVPAPDLCRSQRTKIALIGRTAQFSLGIGLAIAASAVAAQRLPEDECARLKDAEAEIICLRAALAATRQAQPGEEPKPIETARANSQSSSAESNSEEPLAGVLPSAGQPARALLPELGREQIAGADGAPRPARDPEVLVDRISDFRRDRTGALIMQLESGQIWRQVENVDLPLRLDEGERPQVEVTRSGFGGYRMHFPAMNRTVSVSRLR